MSAAGVALTGLTMVTAASFMRLFADEASIVPAVLAGLFAHVMTAWARKGRWPPVVTGIALAGGLTMLLAWTVAGQTTAWGIPTGETFQLLGERLADGLGQVRSEKAPIGPHSGVVAVVAVGVWLGAIAADAVAFRARAALSAAIPAATLFTLTASLGDSDRFQAPLTIAFVALTLVFVLAHAPAQAGDVHAWFTTSERRLGAGAALRAGLPVVVLAAVLAPVLGPRLPAARSAGLVDLRSDGQGPRTRVTVSPLVDIRDRLTQSPPVDAFTVRADQPAYWRMAALETYDGQIWSSLADYKKAGGTLPADTEAAPTVTLIQEYAISGLAQFWLPAAYRPVSVDLAGARVNPASLTLLTDQETADGLIYTVESAVPDYGPADLAPRTGRLPRDLAPFLELPAGTSGTVVQLAREVTAGHAGPYAQALALQEWFRANFEYSETVPPGHSGDRMVDFLVHGRAGFCEQFSASFAVMSRGLGIPARVAVGFTPGTPDPTTGAYRVTSAEAHAWPEVYLDPFGWVAFEPTPTRHNPSPANHTGTYDPDAQQAPFDPLDAGPTATTIDASADAGASEGASPPAESPTDRVVEPGNGNPWTLRVAVAAAAVGLLVVAATVTLLERRRRIRRRRLLGLDPAGRILAAWDEVVAQLRLEGIELPDSLTASEVAFEAGAQQPEVFGPLVDLRVLVDAAAYSPADPRPEDAAAAWTAARSIVAVLERDDSAPLRVRRRLTV